MKFLEELRWRGLIYDVINEEELAKKLEEEQLTLYCGFDPTADSLHIGSLLPIVTLMRFHKAGHRVIALTGGGTGLIGDPSGKKNERQMNAIETVHKWSDLFKGQLARFIKFDNKTAFCVDNYEWLSTLSAIDMWRDFGRHFGINYMLSKECVKSRLENGLTYLEFSYMIMQSIDFLKMHQNPILKCDMQIGGQDQWGNITGGLELIRKMHEGEQTEAYGVTVPLVLKSDGTKFGKSESGAVWLDENKTTPYAFYQFWINTPDSDVIKRLKQFTFLSVEEIQELEESFSKEPHLRKAQKALAKEVTTLIHGEESCQKAINLTEALFSGRVGSLTKEEIEMGFDGVTKVVVEGDINIIDAVMAVKAASSKREAREFINNGAVSINGVQEKSLEKVLTKEEALGNKYIIIRRGKKNYYLLEF